MPVSPARRAAFEVLRRVEEENAYSSPLLAADLNLNSNDRALCHELVLGVLRRQLWLDKTIQHFSARRIDKLDLPVLLALRLGLYQLRFLSRIPPSAAVNESVNLVRQSRLKSAAGFANAVLRRATRELKYDPAANTGDQIEKLAIETSHPFWLVERWILQFGFDEASALAHANNSPAPVAFRFTAKTYAEERTEAVLGKLRSKGLAPERSLIARDAWRVLRGDADHQTHGDDGDVTQPQLVLQRLSEEGLIYFQDESSQLVAELVDPQNGERILDVCSAPGSKSTMISALAPGATVVAGDLYEHRTRTIKDSALRQTVRNIEPVVHDATGRLPFRDRLFDRVLVDAPCSGTGTLRHNPEIRWRLQLSDIVELSAKQKTILRNAADMVRTGGVLIYSTCSLEMEENEEVVSHLVESFPDFERLQLKVPATLITTDGGVRTWPHRDDTDGFFIKGFRRKN
jgi:16S rRNA (cytosine967-C5)-methyltransferase